MLGLHGGGGCPSGWPSAPGTRPPARAGHRSARSRCSQVWLALSGHAQRMTVLKEGKRRGPGSEPLVRSFGQARTCAAASCRTQLSRYNPARCCNLHQRWDMQQRPALAATRLSCRSANHSQRSSFRPAAIWPASPARRVSVAAGSRWDRTPAAQLVRRSSPVMPSPRHTPRDSPGSTVSVTSYLSLFVGQGSTSWARMRAKARRCNREMCIWEC